MTVAQWHERAVERLYAAGDPDAKTDASLFLCAVLQTERGRLRFLSDRELTHTETAALETMLARREEGEPEQYVEGAAYFMGLRFNVDSRALIPRFDTEALCEAAIGELKRFQKPRVLDMCTGSGCIAVAIAHFCPEAAVTACDISIDALDLAKRNAALNGVSVEYIQSDGFWAVRNRRFDLIVCNPPYLTRLDMENLQREVKYEPALALYGGEDGLDFYRRFAGEMRFCLAANAAVLFEVGQGQAETVADLFAEAHPNAAIDTIKDLNGVKRAVRMRF